MQRLDDARYAELLGAVYDAAVDPTKWQVFLDLLSKTFGGSALFYAFDALSQTTPYSLASGFDAATLAKYEAHFVNLNPYPTAAVGLPADTIMFAHDVVAPADVARSDFYAEILRPTAVNLHHLAVKPIHDENRFAVLALSPSLKVYEREPDAALRELDRLRPHITRAIQINRFSAAQSHASKTIEAMLEAFSAAVFLLDGLGRPIHLNAAANTLMQRDRLLRLSSSRQLKAFRQQDAGKFALLLGHGARGNSTTAEIFSSATGTAFTAWTVPVSAMRSNDRQPLLQLGEALLMSGSTLLFVVPTHTRQTISPTLIGDVFRLTAAEARLVSAICAGHSLIDYAKHSGISIKTVRNQLTSVFAKTGTNRQPELVARVTTTLGPRIHLLK